MVDINTARLPTPVAAFVGLLSVSTGLGVGHLVGGFVSPSSSPFLAVGGTAVDFTPIWLKDFAVRTFGSYNKLVLLSGVAVVIGLIGVTNGLLSRRSQQNWLGSPTAVLTDPGRQAMLVIGMNREPLPIEHSFPVRMIVPELYGFVSSTKWITDMELATFGTRRAYWLQRGWGQRAHSVQFTVLPDRPP